MISFFLVRCEGSIPGQFGYLDSVKKTVGSFQDDKDILTTGLVFDYGMLDSYTKAGYLAIQIY